MNIQEYDELRLQLFRERRVQRMQNLRELLSQGLQERQKRYESIMEERNNQIRRIRMWSSIAYVILGAIMGASLAIPLALRWYQATH